MNNQSVLVAVEEQAAVDMLLSLNQISGATARFVEQEATYDESQEHGLYSLDLETVSQIAVAGLTLAGHVAVLTTALLNFRTTRRARSTEQRAASGLVIYINGNRLEITDSDTSDSVEEKLRGLNEES